MARFVVLDGLRGVAALMVVGLHVGECLKVGLFAHGYLMVDLFFLLSGFVLSAGYGERLDRGRQGGWFARKRIARLYPLFLLGLAVGAIVHIASAAGGLRELPGPPALLLLLSAAFLPWLAGGLVVPFNGPAWSLQLELWINLIYGVVARFLTTGRLAAVVLAAGLALAASTVATGAFDGGFANNDPSRSAGPFSYLTGWARVAFSFPLGILLHRLWAEGRLAPLTARFAGWAAPAALALLALAPAGLPFAFDLMTVLLLFPILLVLAANADIGVWVAGLYERLGRLSYGLYVLHGPILLAFKALEPSEALPARLAWYGLAVVVALVAAALGERWIDRPLRRWFVEKEPAFIATTARTANVQVRSG